MIEIIDLERSVVYLNRDQKHLGRVIVTLKGHKREYHELEEQERNQYFKEVAMTAQAMENLFYPDKINYATFGDLQSHVHIHMVPKHKDGLFWGVPFKDLGEEKKFLSDEEYTTLVEQYQKEFARLLG